MSGPDKNPKNEKLKAKNIKTKASYI